MQLLFIITLDATKRKRNMVPPSSTAHQHGERAFRFLAARSAVENDSRKWPFSGPEPLVRRCGLAQSSHPHVLAFICSNYFYASSCGRTGAYRLIRGYHPLMLQ
jgi:hypothetical protein